VNERTRHAQTCFVGSDFRLCVALLSSSSPLWSASISFDPIDFIAGAVVRTVPASRRDLIKSENYASAFAQDKVANCLPLGSTARLSDAHDQPTESSSGFNPSSSW